MYSLTLTADERRAFDWVGDRYNSGKVADLLLDCIPEDVEWGDDGEITFQIPEHVAWEIRELAEEEDHSWDQPHPVDRTAPLRDRSPEGPTGVYLRG